MKLTSEHLGSQNTPNTRRVEMESTAPALFLAVHLYFPSMNFAVFGNWSSDPSSVSFTSATEGRSPSLKIQDSVGFGTPVALQLMLVLLPSGTVWFLGDT